MKALKFILYVSIVFFLIILINCKEKQIKDKEFTFNHLESNPKIEIQKNAVLVCSPESKKIDYCIEKYQPVCGWFVENPKDCQNSYCRESFANECFACKDRRVLGYTFGNCKQN